MYEDCVVWTDWGFALGVTYGTRGPIRDLIWRRCDVLRYQRAAMAIYALDGGTIQGVRFDDIRVEHQGMALTLLRLTDATVFRTDQQRGLIRKVYLDNITVTAPGLAGSHVQDFDANHDIREVVWRNYRHGKKKLTNLQDAGIRTNEFTRDVRVE